MLGRDLDLGLGLGLGLRLLLTRGLLLRLGLVLGPGRGISVLSRIMISDRDGGLSSREDRSSSGRGWSSA